MNVTTYHGPPRAGIDPIDHHESGLMTVALACHTPPQPETVVVYLDDDRRGVSIVTVTGTDEPDAVVDVVERLTHPLVHDGRIAAVVVATVRTTPDDAATAERDIDRWLEISDAAEQHGVELVEWYVLGPLGARCPRDELGELPRW
jgi:hypothetical protein